MINKRKGYKFILDVETAGDIGSPLIFDIGYTILNQANQVVEQKGFLVKEIWRNKKLMDKAYYSCNIPLYEKVERTEMNWAYVRKVIENKIETCEQVLAYNGAFDKRAIQSTNEFLNKKQLEVPMECIWSMALQTICTTKEFRDFAKRENLLTASKKFYQSNAEATYKFITGIKEFKEAHMGMEDSAIESVIFKYIMDTGKEFDITKKPCVFGNMEI